MSHLPPQPAVSANSSQQFDSILTATLLIDYFQPTFDFPTSSSSSRPDEQTSSAASSPPIQTSTSEPPAQSSSSSPPSSVINTSSAPVSSPSPSSQPAQNTFSSQLPAPSSQASSQIVVVTSNVYQTSADPNGGIHTLTSYVEVTVDRPATTVSAPGSTSIARLHNGDDHQPGFFDNRGAVIGTFLTVGLIVLGGSAAIIWRLARLRRARLRARENEDAELNFNKFVGNDDDGRVAMLPLDTEHDDFQNIPLDREPQLPQISEPLQQLEPQFSNQQVRDPMFGYHDNPSHSHMQEVYPVRLSNRTNLTGRSSDLDTMNSEEWGRYINTHFSTGGGRAFGDGLIKPELVRVDEEGAVRAGPPIVISSAEPGPQEVTGFSSFHPPPGPQPEIQTVEQETFTMVSPPQFALDDQIPTADQRLEPTVLPGYSRPRSDEQRDELSSLRDEEDYSRRILRVSNPDRQDQDDQPSTPQT
ncbi:hypothetical protein PtA15_18A456 [Puccinia triticina]|uniref:Uncharacterized protein n=1 Tax=Puccinia triticina TaxID=208348 RepID=A0ABY7DBH3_9BASI|nr:uncharacterized protein PtA15_18A456 [Puccinia triticina]WAQ93395.1 hypothetical protein PtA15_18A456 [Puccinia triticina]